MPSSKLGQITEGCRSLHGYLNGGAPLVRAAAPLTAFNLPLPGLRGGEARFRSQFPFDKYPRASKNEPLCVDRWELVSCRGIHARPLLKRTLSLIAGKRAAGLSLSAQRVRSTLVLGMALSLSITERRLFNGLAALCIFGRHFLQHVELVSPGENCRCRYCRNLSAQKQKRVLLRSWADADRPSRCLQSPRVACAAANNRSFYLEVSALQEWTSSSHAPLS
jgi:hypothetical protein